MEQFIMKTKVYMGRDALKHLHGYHMEKAMIVCDPFMQESGKVKQLEEILKEGNVESIVFSQVVPDPDLYTVSMGIACMNSFQADTLIAFGGGSAMDTAKAIRYICERQDQGKDSRRIGLVAIPTTSGTGSEVTSFAVITDQKSQTKYPLKDDEMLPDLAFLDPEMTLSVPRAVTADTGMDVLTHAIESFVSIRACDFCDAFAEKAIRIIFTYLERVVKDGSDYTGREHIHNASCMAGICFNSTSLGLCHAMAHALGARFHISHGRSNALLLGHVVMFNGGKMPQRFAELANSLGISNAGDKNAVFALARRIWQLQKRVGIPSKIMELKIEREVYLNAIPQMAEMALADACLKTNPCPVCAEEIQQIFQKLI